jgi:iron complex outermembrane recepter protein
MKVSRKKTLLLFGLLALLLVAGSVTTQAQTKQLLQWLNDLRSLQNTSGDDLAANKDAVVQIRRNIDLWVKMHPDTKIELKAAADQPWGNDEVKNQVAALTTAIEAILKEDQDRPFNLGMTEISVTSEASPLSPMAEVMDRKEIVNLQALNVATAIDYLPGVSMDRSGSRNEAGLRLRGFGNKGQVPLYLDGIPIYVPYDGGIDLTRFLTSDIAEIQVAKGYSSPLLGPNNLGGSVNLVTRQPVKKFEADALIGTGSGDQLLSSLNLGTKWQKFYFQGAVDWWQRDSFPLSGNFPVEWNRYQTTYKRNQSNARDEKYSGRVAWTPRSQDQYVFSYINQKGEKGNPPYGGLGLDARPRYWRWPLWNKNSYYFISNTGFGESSSIKFRAYYDQYRNGLDTYANNTYSTLSNRSNYNEQTAGSSTEFTTRIIPRNTISASFFLKDDIHKEITEYLGNSPYTTAILHDRSQQISIGLQDVITISSRLRATFGFSADHLNGREAQIYANKAQTAVQAIQCLNNPDNTDVSKCTAHMWTYNPQASVSYTLPNSDTIFFTFADRSRFPMLKETYSYGLGSAIPNPELKPEHSRNWTAGYSHTFGAKTVAQIEFFRSDLRDAIQKVYVPDPTPSNIPGERTCYSNRGALANYCSQNYNIAQEDHEGMEINIRSTPFSRLTMEISYSYLNRRLDYGFDENPNVDKVNTSILTLSSVPKNKVIANATVHLPRQIIGMATFKYEGGLTLQDNDAFGNYLPSHSTSFGTVDLGTVVPVYKGISLQAGLKNLFDRDYYYNAGYPEAGRTWYFNGRYRF